MRIHCFLLMTIFCLSALAQDTLVSRSEGTLTPVHLIKVTESSILYAKPGTNEPVYTVNRAYISEIRYSNGFREKSDLRYEAPAEAFIPFRERDRRDKPNNPNAPLITPQGDTLPLTTQIMFAGGAAGAIIYKSAGYLSAGSTLGYTRARKRLAFSVTANILHRNNSSGSVSGMSLGFMGGGAIRRKKSFASLSTGVGMASFSAYDLESGPWVSSFYGHQTRGTSTYRTNTSEYIGATLPLE